MLYPHSAILYPIFYLFMSYKNSEEYKRSQQKNILEKIAANENGHKYVEGTYENQSSKLVVYCTTHGCSITTTFNNYRRCKTGLTCCGKKSVSEKLSGRVYSPETIEKMRDGALHRPARNFGTEQSWRRSRGSVRWHNDTMALWNHQCAVTGEYTELEVHHYFSGNKRSGKESLHHRYRNVPEAAIVLSKKVHQAFHKGFGYEDTTLDHFICFVEKLISSQAHQEWWEGSETRGEKPERLQRLHERLRSLSLP